MKRSFPVNLLFLLLLNLLIKPIYKFGVEVGVQNAVGPEEFGIYYAMLNFTFLFNVLLDMGMGNYQKIAVAEDEHLGLSNMQALLPLKFFLALLYFTVTATSAVIFGFEGRYWFFIGWLMFNHALSAFLLLLRSNLSGLHLFVKDSILSVTDRLIMVVSIGGILMAGYEHFRIEWFVLFQTLAYTITIALAFYFTPAAYRWPRFSLKAELAIELLKKCWPFALLIVLMTLYSKVDAVMLERLAPTGPVASGIYAQAYRLLDAGNNYAFLYAGLLLPMFARYLYRGNTTDLARLSDQAARFLIVPAVCAFIIAYLFAEQLMELLYVTAIAESATLLKWLMGTFVCISVGYVYGTVITATRKLKGINTVAAAAVVLNVLLNFWLIPQLGATGAAMASLVSMLVMAAAQLFIAIRLVPFMDFRWLTRAIPYWIIIAVAGWLLYNFMPGRYESLAVYTLFTIVTYLIVMVRKTDIREFANLKKTES
ncbi:MAG: hypothetical protein Kow0075_09150 [Salibacteraceae bacterium]